jgi:CHAD domain-containing protein
MALDANRLLKPVKKLRKLVKKIPAQPTPDEVHGLRTNTRRLEAIFDALSLDGHGTGKTTLKHLARLRKRAGKVRDMDVLTGYASTVHVPDEGECLVRLLEHLGATRRGLAKKLHREVKRLRPPLRNDLYRTQAVLARLVRKNRDGAGESAAGENASASAVKLAAQLANPRRLSRQTLHPYRLKVKELRNVLQMAAGPARPKFVKALGEVKDAIGEWHDWEELAGIAEKVLDHGKECGLMAELKRMASSKYDHAVALAESLRKEYLRRAPQRKRIPAEPVLRATAMLAG